MVDICLPITCTRAVGGACPLHGRPPVSELLSSEASLAGWAAAPCLEALCVSRDDPAGAAYGSCPDDAAEDVALVSSSYVQLNGSGAFAQLLPNASESLGVLSLVTSIRRAPACP